MLFQPQALLEYQDRRQTLRQVLVQKTVLFIAPDQLKKYAGGGNEVSVTTGEALTVPANDAIPIYIKDDKGGVPEGSWSGSWDEPSGGSGMIKY